MKYNLLLLIVLLSGSGSLMAESLVGGVYSLSAEDYNKFDTYMAQLNQLQQDLKNAKTDQDRAAINKQISNVESQKAALQWKLRPS